MIVVMIVTIMVMMILIVVMHDGVNNMMAINLCQRLWPKTLANKKIGTGTPSVKHADYAHASSVGRDSQKQIPGCHTQKK